MCQIWPSGSLSMHIYIYIHTHIYIHVHTHIYIYIYIYCHPQTDLFRSIILFSVARQAKFLKLGSKSCWLKRQSKILPLSHKETSASKGNLNTYVSHLFLFTYIRLTATKSSIQSTGQVCVCMCLRIYIYIYIYKHIHTHTHLPGWLRL